MLAACAWIYCVIRGEVLVMTDLFANNFQGREEDPHEGKV